MIQQERGNYGEAERLYRQSLTMNERLGDQAGTAFSWGALGRLAEKRGDLNVAAAYYEKALRLFQKTGQRQYEKLAKDDLDRVLSRLRKGIQK